MIDPLVLGYAPNRQNDAPVLIGTFYTWKFGTELDLNRNGFLATCSYFSYFGFSLRESEGLVFEVGFEVVVYIKYLVVVRLELCLKKF